MRTFLMILLVGLVTFLGVAMIQEWEVFATSWFGMKPEQELEISAEDRAAAQSALDTYLTLMRHYYSSGGDPRFAERIPASPEVVGEIAADVTYLRHNNRRQEMTLHQIEVTVVIPLSPVYLELHTREHWSIRSLALSDGTELDPARGNVIHTRYHLARDGAEWRVTAWEHMEPGESGVYSSASESEG